MKKIFKSLEEQKIDVINQIMEERAKDKPDQAKIDQLYEERTKILCRIEQRDRALGYCKIAKDAAVDFAKITSTVVVANWVMKKLD